VNTPTDAATVLDVTVRHPTVHQINATVGEVREFLTGEHVHLVLIVDASGLLLTTIDRDDLAADAAGDVRASEVGTLEGRTVRASLPLNDLDGVLATARTRRLAVVDDVGRLVGLVCRKRSGQGFCSDVGIGERRAEVAAP
jgi:CBS-domain-containing membrane protein